MKWTSIENESGSSSILVILTMLMLVLFGVLGMISAYSDYRIAEKNADWTQDYYHFESLAQEQVKILDGLSIEQMAAAQRIYQQWLKSHSISEPLRDDMKIKLETALQKSGADKKNAEKAIYVLLLEDKLMSYDSDAVVELTSDPKESTLLWTKTIILESKRTYMVQVNWLPKNEKRYEVTIWREIPATFDYSKGMEFEDVEVVGS